MIREISSDGRDRDLLRVIGLSEILGSLIKDVTNTHNDVPSHEVARRRVIDDSEFETSALLTLIFEMFVIIADQHC